MERSQPRSLPPQSFSLNNLNRSILERRDANFLEEALPEADILLVSGNQCCVSGAEEGSQEPVSLSWLRLEGLVKMGFKCEHGRLAFAGSDYTATPFLLGHESSRQCWKLALNIAGVVGSLPGLQLRELRSLMSILPAEDLAVAGHAIALNQWHQNHAFCGRCGALNIQIEAGGKMQCTANERHREYPRTDPVAIMMVESVDGSRALLGRPRKLRAGMLTCLSGFIEQGESIEEAVRREVLEEAGIPVGEVAILGSQPWPIGRGGSCELMIGAIAKAQSDTMHVDFEEMDEVRWVSKEDVLRAAAASDARGTYGKDAMADGLDFFVPPKYAIAHHLITTWAASPGSWFSKM